MAKNVDTIVKEADVLIKQEKYAEAWKLLLPHKENENARKRLKWLKAKQEQLKLEKEITAAPVKVSGNWFSRLGWRMKAGIAFLFLCSGCVAFSMLGQTLGFIPDATERAATEVARANETTYVLTLNAPTATETPTNEPSVTASVTDSPSPTETASPSETNTSTPTDSSTRTGISNSVDSSTLEPSPSATITNTTAPRATNTPTPRPTNTLAPPTAPYALYNPDDLCPIGNVEQMLLDELANTEGVDFVESLCIQRFPNGGVWFSADIIVYPDYNILAIPRRLDEIAVAALNEPDLDTFINMSDGVHAIAYTHNKTFPNWDIVVYGSSVIPPTPRPR